VQQPDQQRKAILGAQVARMHGEAGRANGVELASGVVIAADIVLTSIGVTPNSLLAVDALNSPADVIFARKIAGRRLSLDIDTPGAMTTDLKQLVERLLEASQA
jgi:hypothetical protein